MKKVISLLLVCMMLLMFGASHAGGYTGTVIRTSSSLSGNFNLVTLSDGITYIYFGPSGLFGANKASSVFPAVINDLLLNNKTATFTYNDDWILQAIDVNN